MLRPALLACVLLCRNAIARHRGGVAIIQHPDDAVCPSIPDNAFAAVDTDYRLSAADIGALLNELCTEREAEQGKSRLRVLVVEDEWLVANTLRKDLAAMGYEPCGAVPTGEEVVDLARGLRPDLVLMDMRLAGQIDGAQAGTTIWKTLDIPVVYLTAHADGRALQEIMRAQPFGYVMEPFCASEVDAAIQLALDRKRNDDRARAGRP